MAVREAKCQHCGDRWIPPERAGFPPMFCDKPDCQEARRLRRNAQIRMARQARERQQRDRRDLIAKVMKEEIAEASTRADERRLASRNDLRRDVRTLAYAMGDEDTYHALLDIAADALAWATRIRPEGAALNPVEGPVEDYGELMVA